MIQGHVKLIDTNQRKAIVHTEYDDLIILRILDGTRVDVGDIIVGSLDSQGEIFVFDHSKRAGMLVYVENGHRLFTAASQGQSSRRVNHARSLARRLSA